MKERRSRILVAVAALAVVGSGCWRSGDVTTSAEGGVENEGGVKKVNDAAKDSSTHRPREGGTADGDAHNRRHDAFVDTGSSGDAATEAGHDATTDGARDVESDAAHDGTNDARHDGGMDAGHDAGVGKDSGGPKEAGFEASLFCSGSACNLPTGTSCGAVCTTLQVGAPPASTSQCLPKTATCAQCGNPGNSVCGDSTNYYGAKANFSYLCDATNQITIMSGVPCAFGCDSTTGTCADFIPANGAGTAPAILPTDVFTCTGAQNGNLVGIETGTGDQLTITVNPTSLLTPPDIVWTKSNGTYGVPAIVASWGAITTSAGGTEFMVAHINSLSLTGTTVTISSPYAIVFLVDRDVSITATTISVAGPPSSMLSLGGRGAPSTLNGSGSCETSASGVTEGCGGAGHGGPMNALPPWQGLGGAGGGFPGSGGDGYGGPFVLAAGSAGGGGSDNAGKGGGALQISACGDISLDAQTLLDASGGVAAGGTSTHVGGYGGGSGGSIILEGATFGRKNSLLGMLAANGGAGGQGFSTNAGGGGGTGGAGGAGETATSAPGVGGPVPVVAGAGGGGGGGAYGVISIGVSPVFTAATTGATISPLAAYANTCTTVSGVPPHLGCSYTLLQ